VKVSLSGSVGGGVLDELSETQAFWLGLATFHLSCRLVIKLKHLHLLASTSFIVHG